MKTRGVGTNGAAGYCDHCQSDVPDGPDICLGMLDGVQEACCGHGWITTPYVLLNDDSRIEGRNAISYFTGAGVGPPPVETVSVFIFSMYDDRLLCFGVYEYDTLNFLRVEWENVSDEEPVWYFDDTEIVLVHGQGSFEFSGLACREENGLVILPFEKVEGGS